MQHDFIMLAPSPCIKDAVSFIPSVSLWASFAGVLCVCGKGKAGVLNHHSHLRSEFYFHSILLGEMENDLGNSE